MNRNIERKRRVALTAGSLAVAAVLLRPQLSQALVVRGDEFLVRSDAAGALVRYERALAIDPRNANAADRAVFAGMERHTPEALVRAVRTADAYLRIDPNDSTVLADRALCLLVRRKYDAAARDFEAAAAATSDARYYVFAGWARLRAGDARGARSMWTRALHLHPGFRPAEIALAEQASR
jgi:Tfp pilus assembly protein PilF